MTMPKMKIYDDEMYYYCSKLRVEHGTCAVKFLKSECTMETMIKHLNKKHQSTFPCDEPNEKRRIEDRKLMIVEFAFTFLEDPIYTLLRIPTSFSPILKARKLELKPGRPSSPYSSVSVLCAPFPSSPSLTGSSTSWLSPSRLSLKE